MIYPQLKTVTSPDVSDNEVPATPDDCAVLVEIEIGPNDGDGADLFSIQVVTPRWLLRTREPRWGRGLLIVPEFSWPAVESAIHKVLMHLARPTWREVAAELAKEMCWEFENYSEPNR